MKVWMFAGVVAGLCAAAPAPQPEQAQVQMAFDLIDLAAISRMTPYQLEMLAEGLAAEEMIRTKRSSANALGNQALGQIASKVTSGFSSKVSLLGQASAGAASFISAASASSKGGGGEHTGYSYGPHEEKKVDFWSLKKSILNTLFQAVKAITGGVTIIKGQIIKGGGALASVAGKLISVKGDAVSNLGKKIVNSAQLVPHKKPHASAPLPSYGPPPSHEYLPSAYGAPPSAPAQFSHTAHSAPSGPSGPGFAAPVKYTSHYEGHGKPLSGLHAGVILLRPLDSDHSPHIQPRPAPAYHAAHAATDSHTALEPPSNFLFSAFRALKNVFGKGDPEPEHEPELEHEHGHELEYPPVEEHNSDHFPPPPPPQHSDSSWGTPLNSYGEPAQSYFHPYEDHTSYDPHDAGRKIYKYKNPKSLTLQKLHKVTENLKKIPQLQRSSAEVPLFDGIDLYRDMLAKHMRTQAKPLLDARAIGGSVPDSLSANAMFLNLNPSVPREPAPVPAGLLSSSALEVLKATLHTTDRPTTTATKTTTTTTTRPESETQDSTPAASKKSPRYVLRGNRIVEV